MRFISIKLDDGRGIVISEIFQKMKGRDMSLADVLSVIAIIVSFVTFAITTYEQYLKAAKLQLILVEEIRLSYGHQFSDLGFWCSVAITNLGAVDAVVLHISGQVTDGQSWTAPVEWKALGGLDVPDEQHKGSSPSFVFKDWAESFVATSRKTLTNWIYFSIYPLPLANGEPVRIKSDTTYSLQLHAEVPATRWSLFGNLGQRRAGAGVSGSWTGAFQLSADDITYLESPSCVADDKDWVQDSVIAKLSGTSRWLRPQSPTVPVTDRRAIDQLQVPRPGTERPAQAKP